MENGLVGREEGIRSLFGLKVVLWGPGAAEKRKLGDHHWWLWDIFVRLIIKITSKNEI